MEADLKLVSVILLFSTLFVASHQADNDIDDKNNYWNLPLYSSCSEILQNDANSPSGEYSIQTSTGRVLVRVYCEMGLDGGGYTFLHPFDLPQLTDAELQEIFKNKTSFLMRLRKTDGTQPYGVLRQLARYGSTPLKLGLSQHTNYKGPVNANGNNLLYLFYGFLPISAASNRNVQGLKVNNAEVTFTNCDSNPNNYIALFPNFRESTPTNYAYSTNFPFSNQMFANHVRNPSGRVIPEDYFMFLETHWGGCGTYTQTDGRQSTAGILAATIGFK